MAEADRDQKTHDPTEKKLADAREQGDVATAPEMRHAAMFPGALVVTGSLGIGCFARLGGVLTSLWGNADDFRIAPAGAQALMTALLGQVAGALAPLFGALMLCALVGAVLQARPTLAWTRIMPKWSKLSPFAGAKRILGMRALVEFGKTLAKLGLVGGIAVALLWPRAAALDRLVGADPIVVARTPALLR